MRVQTPKKPGFFLRAGRQYMALSEVPRTVNVTAAEVADAVALGELPIDRVAGCKIVLLADVFEWIEMKGGRK